MFKLNEKNDYIRNILKRDCIRYSPSEISTIKTPKSQTYVKIPREDRVNSLLESSLDLNFDVLHAATGNRCVYTNNIKLSNLGSIALFSKYKLTTSSGKHLEDIDQADIVSLMYKQISCARDTDDLSISFDRSGDRRQRELTNNKTQRGNSHSRTYLNDIFGFAEQQEEATYVLVYKLTLRRNTDNAVLNKDNAINNAKIKITAIEWFVPHYTPSI